MSKASDIRNWLREHPGDHFASEILDGLEINASRERALYCYALQSLVDRELLVKTGPRKHQRYSLAEPANSSVGMSAYQARRL